jgi:hypothetical protein
MNMNYLCTFLLLLCPLSTRSAEYRLLSNIETPLAHRVAVSAGAAFIYLIALAAHARYQSRKRPLDHIRRV